MTRPNGPWTIVRRRVYIETDAWERTSERSGRPLLRVIAAHLTTSVDHVLSHTSAGWALGLPMLRPPNDLVHVTRPTATGSRTEHGIKHHPARYPADAVVTAHGIPVLNLARTAVDIGREHGFLHGLVACDAARQRGVTLGQFAEVLDAMAHWPHVSRARAAVLASDPGAESVGETLARDFVISLGLGPVVSQFSIVCGAKVHFVDLRVGRHLIEFDGRVKYLRRAEGGFAGQPEGQVVWDEKKRQTEICGEGYGMSRLVWDELWGPARQSAAERIRTEYAQTEARFGTELPAGYVPVPRTTYSRAS